MNQRYETLLADRYQNHPLLAGLKAILETSQSFAAKAAQVKTDAHLSVAGRAAKTEKLVKETLRELREMTVPVESKRAQLAEVVARIRPTSFDRTDLSGALLRQEMRASVKAMSLAERASVLTGEKVIPEFVDAVLEAPRQLSGLDENLYEQIREARLENLYASESLEAESLSNEIEDAQAILTLAKQDVAAASGLLGHEFAAPENDVASGKDSPWLRKEKNINGEEIIVVVPTAGGPARRATADEQSRGQFFANHSAYLASRAA
jgi:hypothetical protein